MRYSIEDYAQALANVSLKKLGREEEKHVVKNFTTLLKKNGDVTHAEKIFARAETLIRRVHGDQKLIIESARPLGKSGTTLLREMRKRAQIVEERVRPELVAGIRVVINDEDEFDASLKRKLDLLFA